MKWFKRPPDFVIGGKDSPYMLRWWVIPRNRFFNVYLHKILRDDDDRALHDHPWWNISIVLKGGYLEVIPNFDVVAPTTPIGLAPQKIKFRYRGSIVLRRATDAHRLCLFRGTTTPTWTLFVTGPVQRQWGFHCRWGWRYWKDFVAMDDPGAVGKGCE